MTRVDSGRAGRPPRLNRAVADAAVSGAEIRVFGACPAFGGSRAGVRGRAPAAMLSNRIANSTTKVSSRQILRLHNPQGRRKRDCYRWRAPGTRAPALSLHHTLNTALVAAGCAAVPQPSLCRTLARLRVRAARRKGRVCLAFHRRAASVPIANLRRTERGA